jgi:hypothetical protein
LTYYIASNGRIIIYGGESVDDKPAYPVLAVLDIVTYSWSLPQEINSIGPVILAASVMVDNFMVLYAGK